MSTVRKAPRFFKPKAHFNLQPINIGPRLENYKNSILNSIMLKGLYFQSYCAELVSLKPLPLCVVAALN